MFIIIIIYIYIYIYIHTYTAYTYCLRKESVIFVCMESFDRALALNHGIPHRRH